MKGSQVSTAVACCSMGVGEKTRKRRGHQAPVSSLKPDLGVQKSGKKGVKRGGRRRQ